MRIAIVSQYFHPDRPGRIADELSQGLADRGHEVRVLSTFPHYEELGEVPGGRNSPAREKRGEVLVRRIPIYANHSSNAVGRIVNYGSFVAAARVWASFVKGADVVYVHGTPATAAEPARAWQKRFGIPFVYHVQDIWPESVTGSGFLPDALSKVVETVINSWLGRVYSQAAGVIAIAPSSRELLVERGVAPDQIDLVYNWARDDVIGEVGNRRTPSAGLTVAYAGNLGRLQDLATVVRAAHKVRELPGFRFYIAGSGVMEQELRQLVDDLGADSTVTFLGKLSGEEMRRLYPTIDFQVIPLKRMGIFEATIPSKLQAGLANGVPAITTVQGDVSRLVAEHGLGYTAQPEDVDALAAVFRRAHASNADERRALSQNALEFYAENFTKDSAIDKIESILNEAVLRSRKSVR